MTGRNGKGQNVTVLAFFSLCTDDTERSIRNSGYCLVLDASILSSESRGRMDSSERAERRLLVGAPDVSFASVAEEMQRPVYFMECNCIDTFKLFSHQREDFPDEEVVNRLSNTINRLNASSLVFVFWRALLPGEIEALKARSLSISLLKEFTGADSRFENHYIYRIGRDGRIDASVGMSSPQFTMGTSQFSGR